MPKPSMQHAKSPLFLILTLVLGSSITLADAAPTPERITVIPESQPGAPPLDAKLRERLAQRLESLGPDHRPRTRNLRADGSPLFTNRLLLESSPYLQQHAHNPVDWHPWGDEAFATARRLGRPVLISIGYSTCHWCHVMEEESFDDPVTAKFLNERFIAVKVDREARPDVDSIYMAAIHALGIRGGWPLNVFVTPDRKPFYGGTYFPPQSMGRRPGFQQILEAIHSEWTKNAADIERQADEIVQRIEASLQGSQAASSEAPTAKALEAAVRQMQSGADPQWGGVGIQPKFPSSLPIRLLLRYVRRSGDKDVLAIATLTLEKMAAGGIRDHVGGGFHRYSTDQRWLIPHFEKMLYDNALLAQDYLEAWQLTGRTEFSDISREILAYVEREMTSAAGGYYSATDADSLRPDGEAEEGWFFTWTIAEIEAALEPARAREIIAYYGVTPAGNFEGRNNFHAWRSLDVVAAELEIEPALLRENLAESRAKLYAVRSQRIPPLRDDKILVSWNGLMISAFARAGLALDEPGFTQGARNAATFVLDQMRDDSGRLRRIYKDGRADGPAFLQDYAFLIKGLLDLYEADPDPRWLEEAIALQKLLDTHYRDDVGGGYFTVADDGETLLVREKPDRDGAVPSGNSIAALNLLRLAEFTSDTRYDESANMIFAAHATALDRGSAGLSEMFIAVDFQLDAPKEIVIVAPESGAGLSEMLAPLRRTFLPNRVLIVVREGESLEHDARLAPLAKGKLARKGTTTAYVCENRVCAYPTESPETFAKQIAQTRKYER